MSTINTKKYRSMTKAQADELHHQLFENKVQWAKAVLDLDVQITELKAKAEKIAEPFREAEKKLLYELEMFIINNRELFQKPRKPKTAWGTYGLQGQPDKVEIDDAAAVDAFSTEHDLGLSVSVIEERRVTSFDMLAIAELLRKGETIPGARLIDAKEPKITFNQKLIDEAAKKSN